MVTTRTRHDPAAAIRPIVAAAIRRANTGAGFSGCTARNTTNPPPRRGLNPGGTNRRPG